MDYQASMEPSINNIHNFFLQKVSSRKFKLVLLHAIVPKNMDEYRSTVLYLYLDTISITNVYVLKLEYQNLDKLWYLKNYASILVYLL